MRQCHPESRLFSPFKSQWPSPCHRLNGVFALARILIFLHIIAVFIPLSMAADRPILHHNLIVHITPATHEIVAQDTIIVTPENQASLRNPLRLTLNRNLQVEDVLNGSNPILFDIIEPSKKTNEEPISVKFIEISDLELGNSSSPLNLVINYKGKIHDPPRPSRGLRFVRPDKTLGHIGQEGTYLSSETAWYPDLPGTLSTFSIEVTLPPGWTAVTQGHQIAYQSDQRAVTAKWEADIASEALTLAANQFVKHERKWQGIEIATYLFPEDSHLSEQYLDATARYLEVYTALLGPYPFRKFAIVENFFPSGLGLPSFTLLGSRVIKRGYTQPYSLGHEIVHSWIGNSVLNDFSKGNWVEGLTTYLANYYFEELHGSPEASLKQRRRMLYEYNLYVPPPEDYPLNQFHHKETRIDNAIGYQKSAMIFHMLRNEIGDEAFFSSIRALVKEKTGVYADWNTLQHVFEKSSKRELEWFVTQWVKQPGAPSIKILSTEVRESHHTKAGFIIDVNLEQTGSAYQVTLPIAIQLDNGTSHHASIMIKNPKDRLTIPVPAKPIHLAIDPQFNVFRRLQRDQIPPMLNKWVTDQNPLIILPDESFREESSIYQPILSRLESRGLKVLIPQSNESVLAEGQSQLILDNPATHQLTAQGLKHCPDDLAVTPKTLTIGDKTFEGPNVAWLISCPHPSDPGHTVTLFSGFTDPAVARIARLLFFYGWDSYLVFDNGKVIFREVFETMNENLTASWPGT